MNSSLEAEIRFTELVSFIRDKSGEHKISITRETLIEDDLGVTGDDALELIEEFGKKYQIDIAEFKFKKYFNGEPSILLPDREVQRFTVGHLEKAIIVGRLNDEVINS